MWEWPRKTAAVRASAESGGAIRKSGCTGRDSLRGHGANRVSGASSIGCWRRFRHIGPPVRLWYHRDMRTRPRQMRFGWLIACVAVAFAAVGQESALRRAVDPLSPAQREALEEAAAAERALEEATPLESLPEAEQTSDDLRAAVAQLMFVTLQGSTGPSPADRALLRDQGVGGVIVPPVTRQTVASEYITAIRTQTARHNRFGPVLIGTDLFNLPRSQHRFRSYFAQMPSLMAVAGADHPPATKRFAEATADQLRGMGFTLHVGPALSLAPEVDGGLATVQSFGSDPEFAARTARTFCETLIEASIIPMPTGFPGGANNRIGSAPPVLLAPATVLEVRDLMPFRAAIEAGVPIMHVGTTLVPTLDSASTPACLSAVVMREWLRNRLEFAGVIVAGPIDAPEILASRSIVQASLEALAAGADMLVWTGDHNRVGPVIDRVTEAVRAGVIPEEQIRASVARISRMKEDFALATRPGPDARTAQRQERDRSYGEMALEIERRSVTVLYDRSGVLPLREGQSEPILVTGSHFIAAMDESLEKHFKRVLVQPLKSAQHGGEILDFDIQRLVRQAAGLRSIVAVFPSGTPEWRAPKARASQRNMIEAIKASGTQVVIVLLGYPDPIDHLLEADAVVLAYPPLPDRAGPPLITRTVQAVADVLSGMGPIRILPPLRDIEAVVGQPENYNAHDVMVSPTGRLPVAIGSLREPGRVLFPAGHGMPMRNLENLRRARWQFGDGGRARGPSVTHTHRTAGRYPITLTVEDENRSQVEATFFVTVREPGTPATATAESP